MIAWREGLFWSLVLAAPCLLGAGVALWWAVRRPGLTRRDRRGLVIVACFFVAFGLAFAAGSLRDRVRMGDGGLWCVSWDRTVPWRNIERLRFDRGTWWLPRSPDTVTVRLSRTELESGGWRELVQRQGSATCSLGALSAPSDEVYAAILEMWRKRSGRF